MHICIIKYTYSLDEILQVMGSSGKYSIKNCSLEHFQQFVIKIFLKLYSIKLLSKVFYRPREKLLKEFLSINELGGKYSRLRNIICCVRVP